MPSWRSARWASSPADAGRASRRSPCGSGSTRACALRGRRGGRSPRRYSVSLLTHWADAGFDQVWLKQLEGEPAPAAGWLGMPPRPMARGTCCAAWTRSTAPRSWACPAPWHERLPHFRLGLHPEQRRRTAVGVPAAAPGDRRRAARAATACAIGSRRCCRCPRSAPSPPTISGCPRRRDATPSASTSPGCSDTAAVLPAVAAVEAALRPFAARPHWGKVFGTAPEDVRSTLATAARRRAAARAPTTRKGPSATT